MEFKNMLIKCIQEDCLKLGDLKNACSVFQRYSLMTDLEVIQIYDEYFGLTNEKDEGFLCMD